MLALFLFGQEYSYGQQWHIRSSHIGTNLTDDIEITGQALHPVNGSFYLYGHDLSGKLYVPPSSLPSTEDGFILHMDSTGNLLYQFQIRGNGTNDLHTVDDMAVSPDGTLYLCGTFTGQVQLVAGSPSSPGSAVTHNIASSQGNSQDVYLLAISPTGDVKETFLSQSPGDERNAKLSIDSNGFCLAFEYLGQLDIFGITNTVLDYDIALVRQNRSGSRYVLTGGGLGDDHLYDIVNDQNKTYISTFFNAPNPIWSNVLTGTPYNPPAIQSPRNHHLAAFSHVNGSQAWNHTINDPSGSVSQTYKLTLANNVIYTTTRLGNGSDFGSGPMTIGSGSSDRALTVAKHNIVNGQPNWIQQESVISNGGYFIPRDITTHKNGIVAILGDVDGDVSFNSETLTGMTEDIFFLEIDPTANTADLRGIPSSGFATARAANADHYGGYLCSGTLESSIQFNQVTISNPNTRLSGVWRLTFTRPNNRAVDPSIWEPVDSYCSARGSIDLNNLLVPSTNGGIDRVIGTNSGLPPSALLGPADLIESKINLATPIIFDLGDTIPTGEMLNIHWRHDPASSLSLTTLNIEAFLDNPSTGSNLSVSTGESDHLVWSEVRVNAPTRFLRLSSSNTSSFFLDAIEYSFGAWLGGSWSSPGNNVSNGQLDITGLSGPQTVSYTYGAYSTTQTIDIVATDPIRVDNPGPLCSTAAPIVLDDLLIRHADTLINTIIPGSNHLQILGAPDDQGGILQTAGTPAILLTHLEDTIPQGSFLSIRWKKHSGYAANLVAEVAVFVSANPNGPYIQTAPNILSTSNSAIWRTDSVRVPINARYVTLRNGSEFTIPLLVDAISFDDPASGGTWTVNGSPADILDPSDPNHGSSVPITYTAPSQPCPGAEFNVDIIQATSPGGVIDAMNAGCFNGISDTLVIKGNAGPIITWQWSKDGFSSSPVDTIQTAGDTLILSGIEQGDQFRVLVDISPCSDAFSNTLTIDAIDTEGPIFSNCPTDTIVYVSASACTTSFMIPALAYKDSCDSDPSYQVKLAWHLTSPPIITDVTDSSSVLLPIGRNTLEHTVSDMVGNSTTCTYSIAVLDTIAPQLVCPGILDTLYSDANCQVSIPSFDSFFSYTDNCTGPITTMQSPSPSSFFTTAPKVSAWFAVRDSYGNVDTCFFEINFTDTIAPRLLCPSDSVILTNSSSCTIDYVIPVIPTLDNCGGVNADSLSITSGSITTNFPTIPDTVLLPIGVHNISKGYKDRNGNSRICTWMVVVRDGFPPVLSCPSDTTIVINANCMGSAPNLVSKTSFTDCGNVTLVQNIPPGTTLSNDTVIYLISSDNAGNVDSCAVSVFLNIPAFTLNCNASDSIIFTDNNCNAFVPDLRGRLQSIACAPITITQSIAAGTVISNDTSIQLIVTDGRGRIDSCRIQIHVQDTTPPVLILPSSMTLHLDTLRCDTVLSFKVSATDNCSTISTSHTSGPALGDTLTAGTYYSTYTATDASGNTHTDSTRILVNPPFALNVDYGGSDFCTSSSPIAPSFTLTTGALFSASPELDIDPITGVITPINAGIYSITYGKPTVGPSCNGSWTGSITIIDSPNAGLDSMITVCMGESITLTDLLRNNNTILGTWSNGSSNYTASLTDTVYYIARNGICNADSAQFIINTIDQPNAGASTSLTVCRTNDQFDIEDLIGVHDNNGEWFLLNGSLWVPTTATTFDPQTSGSGTYDYKYEVLADGEGCNEDSSFVSITVAPENITGTLGADLEFCTSSPTEVDLFSGFSTVADNSGNWFDINTHIAGVQLLDSKVNTDSLNSGVYKYVYRVQSSQNCPAALDTVTLILYELNNAGLGGNDTTLCQDGGPENLFLLLTQFSDTVAGNWTGPGSYSGTGLFDPQVDLAGLYTYTVPAIGVCPANTATVNISLAPSAGPEVINTLMICDQTEPIDMNLLLHPNALAGGLWQVNGDSSTGTFVPGTTPLGTYQYTVLGCTGLTTSEIHVVQKTVPDASWSMANPLCETSLVIDLSNMEQGQSGGTWSGAGVVNGQLDPSSLTQPFSLISYTVDNGDCSSTQSDSIFIIAPPLANAGNDAEICDLSITLNAAPNGANGSWSSVETGITFSDQTAPQATATVSSFGIYEFIWTTNNGTCTANDTVEVAFFQPIDPTMVNAGPDQVLDIRPSTSLNATLPTYASGMWGISQGSAVIADTHEPTTFVNELQNGTNTLIWRVTNGPCLNITDSVDITLNNLFIPTGFSPNGDLVNDVFRVTGINEYPNAQLQVFDRWGIKVYEKPQYKNEWDGRSMNGRELPDDTYFVVLQLEDGHTYTGHVIIKR